MKRKGILIQGREIALFMGQNIDITLHNLAVMSLILFLELFFGLAVLILSLV